VKHNISNHIVNTPYNIELESILVMHLAGVTYKLKFNTAMIRHKNFFIRTINFAINLVSCIMSLHHNAIYQTHVGVHLKNGESVLM